MGKYIKAQKVMSKLEQMTEENNVANYEKQFPTHYTAIIEEIKQIVIDLKFEKGQVLAVKVQRGDGLHDAWIEPEKLI